jgi:hypothetical protein
MKRKAKSPARPQGQPDAPRKKRRRARRVEREREFSSLGEVAAWNYRCAHRNQEISGRRAEAFAGDDADTTRRKRKKRAVGRLILDPFALDSMEARKGIKIARDRRKDAILAQVARRAGRPALGKKLQRKPKLDDAPTRY